MKKRYFVPACVLPAAAAGYIIAAAVGLPPSFPWNAQTTRILRGLYADAVILLLALAFRKQETRLFGLTLLLTLGAVFSLVQSILTVFPTGQANWYLPLALGLNCAALLLNRARQRTRNSRGEPSACAGAGSSRTASGWR